MTEITVKKDFGKKKEVKLHKFRGKAYLLDKDTDNVYQNKEIIGKLLKVKLKGKSVPFMIEGSGYIISNVFKDNGTNYHKCLITNNLYDFKKKKIVGSLINGKVKLKK